MGWRIIKLLAGFALLLLWTWPADAQSLVTVCVQPNGPGPRCDPVTATAPFPITGSFSTSGFPGASPTTGTPISVTTGGVTGTLPAGTVVVVTNIGTTNAAYCKLGASATTADQYIAPNGGWFAYTVGAATQLTCITSTSTTTVNMVGGAGLPTGTGGGSGGSGGAITAVSGAFASGSLAAGAMVDLLTMRGTVAAGTAASNSILSGGVYNSTPITLTNGQGSATQFDANGFLKVNVAAGAAAGGTSSNFGSAFPTPGTAIGFSDGTNMVAAKVGAIANVAAATNFVNVISGSQYNATPVTVTDTRYQSLQSDVNGYLKVSVAGGAGINANGQQAMTGSSPVVLASNQSVADPCMFQAKSNLAISQNGTSSVQLIALSGSTSIYVCSLSLIAAGATTVALTTGTGSACVTGNAAVIGATTANIANSVSLAANGGLTLGNGGSTVAKGAASSELCMINGSNVFVSGNLTYVQQ